MKNEGHPWSSPENSPAKERKNKALGDSSMDPNQKKENTTE
jgi:hypothetical protein